MSRSMSLLRVKREFTNNTKTTSDPARQQLIDYVEKRKKRLWIITELLSERLQTTSAYQLARIPCVFFRRFRHEMRDYKIRSKIVEF